MTDLQRDHLSASMDGELTREELRFLLSRMAHDSQACASWSRYHVARDVLRRQLPALAPAGFAERVAGAVGGADMARTRQVPRWLRWSTGGAIAAGVAVGALMLAQPTANDSAAPAALAADSALPVATDAVASSPAVTSPAAVPPWLSVANASRYSERAAATLGGSYGEITLPYTRDLAPYRVQAHPQRQGVGYLLLLDPQAARPPRQATVLQ